MNAQPPNATGDVARAPATVRLSSEYLAAIFFGALLFVTFLKVHDYDLFWHVKTGEQILERGELAFPSVVTHTNDGRVIKHHDWLIEIVLYGLSRLDSVNVTGLILFQSLVFVGIYAFLWRLGRSVGLAPAIVAPILVASFLVIRFRLQIRPFMITYLMLAAFMFFLVRAMRQKDADFRVFAALPLLGAVWANSHPLVALGVFLSGLAFAISAIADGRARALTMKTRVLLGTFLLVAVVSVFSTMHPGFNYARLWYNLTQYNKLVATDEEVATSFALHPEFFGMLAAGAIATPFAIRRGRWFSLAAFWVFGLVALKTVRFVGDFAVVAVPLYFEVLADRPFAGIVERISRQRLVPVLSAAVLAAGFVHAHRTLPAWGAGIDCSRLPCDAVTFLEREAADLRLYNDIAFGGYVEWRAWPRLSAFWDTRFEAQRHLFELLPREKFPEWLAAKGIPVALLANKGPYEPKPLMAIEREIVDAPHWELVWIDRRAIVLAHVEPATADLSERAFRTLKPWEPMYGLRGAGEATLVQALSEARRAVADVADTHNLFMLATVARQAGAREASIEAARACVDTDEKNGSCHALLGLFALEADNVGAGRAHLERAVIYGAWDASTWTNLGVARLRTGDPAGARKAFEHAIWVDPNFAPARENLALLGASK
ncbi:hypothetical protein K8I61_20470 [bacterium]|nr:hypothetical protein [bacterium]